MSKQYYKKNTNKSLQTKDEQNTLGLQKIDPIVSTVIDGWSSKMSLCMLLLASSILFYRNGSDIKIPSKIRQICSVSLIIITCIVSIRATVDFNFIMKFIIENYDEINPVLYPKQMVIRARYTYIISAILVVITNIFIAFAMIKYDKGEFEKKKKI